LRTALTFGVCLPDFPSFASYAALQRRIGHERGYAEWCGWVVDRLEMGRTETG
jgi:hypothetical protein